MQICGNCKHSGAEADYCKKLKGKTGLYDACILWQRAKSEKSWRVKIAIENYYKKDGIEQ